MAVSIDIIRGDDKTIIMTFKNSSGVVIDISGYTVYFTVKREITDTDAQAVIQKIILPAGHSDPENGRTSVDLTHDDTDLPEGVYWYDFQIKSPTGLISSTPRERLSISQDITQEE